MPLVVKPTPAHVAPPPHVIMPAFQTRFGPKLSTECQASDRTVRVNALTALCDALRRDNTLGQHPAARAPTPRFQHPDVSILMLVPRYPEGTLTGHGELICNKVVCKAYRIFSSQKQTCCP